MSFSTAPALLIGIGARILLNTVTRSGDPTLQDVILLGVWQGVGLQYSLKNPGLALAVGFGIFIKLVLEFNLTHDALRSATTLCGVALGVFSTQLLSQLFDPVDLVDAPEVEKRHSRTSSLPKDRQEGKRQRTVQFRNRDGNIDDNAQYAIPGYTVSDITSIDSNSELFGNGSSMTPLEREIVKLRARASLADSERRRYREERKWAISQGNMALASQMKWQVKRYTALMQSFHREADAKLLEASGDRARLAQTEGAKTPVYRDGRIPARGGVDGAKQSRRNGLATREPVR